MVNISLKLTNKGHQRVNEFNLNGTPVLEDGAYLELGTGSAEDSSNLSALVNSVYTKTSMDYTGFTVPEPTPERGLVAIFEIPQRLMTGIISEVGFFTPQGELIIYGNIALDYSDLQNSNMAVSTTIEAALTSVPPDAVDFTINISNNYQTKEQTQVSITESLSTHNTNPDAHSYLARINGDEGQRFKNAAAQNDNEAVNLGQLKDTFTNKKTVINLGTVSGSLTLQFDKLYSAELSGDTTIVLAQPENDNELYNVFFNFTNPEGAYNLNVGANVQFNNGNIPNFKVPNQQRIIFETIDRGENVTAYYGKRGG